MTQAHPHAKKMALYAEDARHSETPWLYWQVRHEGETFNCSWSPSWCLNKTYTRKPDAPDWSVEKFKAGRELTIVEVAQWYAQRGSLIGLEYGQSNWLAYGDRNVGCPPVIHLNFKYRVAPKRTIRVNGIEVPAPENCAPSKGTEYWTADSTKEHPSHELWEGDVLDTKWLALGILYLNEVDAQTRLDAMLKYEEVHQ